MLKYVFVALVATCSADATAGLGASLTQAGVDSLTSIVTPYIFANLKDIKLDEIDFSGGSLKNIDIQIPAPTSTKDIALNLVNADNAIELTGDNLQANLNADFTFKEIITVTGKAQINIKKLGLDVELDLSTQPGTPATDLAPLIGVKKCNVNINPDDIDINLTGGLVSKIANILIPLIKSSVIPTIVKQLESQVTTIITGTLDKDLAEYGTQAEIPYLAGVTFDYGQMNAGPKVSADNVLSGSLNGTFFDAEKVQASQYTPTAFNVRDPNGKMLQAYISDYVLNTAFESGYMTGNTLDLTYLLKQYLNVTVTTDTLGLLIPEILTKYGAGKAVGLAGKFVNSQTESKFTKEGQTLTGSLGVVVTIDNEVAISADFNEFAVSAVLSSKAGAIHGSVSKSTAGTLSDFSTTLGITSDQLIAEIQGAIDTNVAKLNTLLAAGVVIPKVAGIDISDLDLDFFDGYLEFGMSVAPTFWGIVFDKAGIPNYGLLMEEDVEQVVLEDEIKFLQY